MGDAGAAIGLLALHADDTIGVGGAALHEAMRQASEPLKMGSRDQEDFVYKGL